MQQGEQGQQTGTRNETYDVISVLYHALQGAENCQTYISDAQDPQIRSFFEQAMSQQRRLADQGKQVLQQCLGRDTGGNSAFGWQADGQSGSFAEGQISSNEQRQTEPSGSRW